MKRPIRSDDVSHDSSLGGNDKGNIKSDAGNESAPGSSGDNMAQENISNISNKTLDLLDLFIDAKDSVNNWCVARIVEHDLSHYKISVHFDGWSTKYDDVSNFAFYFSTNFYIDFKN